MPFENSDIGFLTFKFKTFVAQGCNKSNRLRLSNVIIELSAYRLFFGKYISTRGFPIVKHGNRDSWERDFSRAERAYRTRRIKRRGHIA